MSTAPGIGAEFAGYRVERLLGRGGVGLVYLAQDLRLPRHVALKILSADFAGDERFRERFVRESRIAASIDHHNIVPIYQAGEVDGVLYIAMRYVAGADLRTLLANAGPLDADRTLSIIGQVASALDVAHMQGLVHRDVKPGNILIVPRAGHDAPDHAYLADFGITKRMSTDVTLTVAGQIAGTVDYVAPEQIKGGAVDGRADIYSLACVLYQCLCGTPPFDRDSDVAVMYAHLSDPRPLLSVNCPELPGAFDDVLATAMAKNPDDRYPTALAFVAAARAALRGVPHREHREPDTVPTGITGDPSVARTAAHSSPPTDRTNLPADLSTFVGRRAEVDAVRALVSEARLVTLTGSGGIGKSRLAVAVASGLVDAYPDGVWWVELAPLTDAELVPHVALSALGFRVQAGRGATESLVSLLAQRKLLCVLDNCEHLIKGCTHLVDTLLQHCPDVSILATSRDVLGVAGELTWRVPSMATPDARAAVSLAELGGYEAVQLFTQRTQLGRPGFEITEDDAPYVARICERLDGIPLAIELAAARTRAMSIASIDERLDNRFRLLTGGSQASMPRQQTLQASIDWSYALLDEAEKQLFQQLSVFGGGFTLEAAEAVGAEADPGISATTVLDALAGLVDKSLVIYEDGLDRRGRYRLLETIRQYGHDRLAESGAADPARQRHANFYLKFADEVEAALRGPQQPVWLARVDAELDNLRAAVEWALAHEPTGALGLGVSLHRYWMLTRQPEGRGWVTRALQVATEPTELRAKGLFEACWWAMDQGDYLEARRFGRECLSLAQQIGSALCTGWALDSLACAESIEGGERWASISLPLFEQAEPHLRKAGDTEALALLLNNWGYTMHLGGQSIAGRPKVEEALALARAAGDIWLADVMLESLASIEFDLGETAAAAAHWKQALAIAGELGSRANSPLILIGLARLAILDEQPQRCLRLLAASKNLLKRCGTALDWAMGQAATDAEDTARRLMAADAADAAWTEGARMSTAEAVRYALGDAVADAASSRGVVVDGEPPAPAPVARPGGLTPRELEVVRLIGEGATNAQIARRLGLSEHTAAKHVANVLGKLELRSRVQVAAWAAEAGLLSRSGSS